MHDEEEPRDDASPSSESSSNSVLSGPIVPIPTSSPECNPAEEGEATRPLLSPSPSFPPSVENAEWGTGAEVEEASASESKHPEPGVPDLRRMMDHVQLKAQRGCEDGDDDGMNEESSETSSGVWAHGLR